MVRGGVGIQPIDQRGVRVDVATVEGGLHLGGQGREGVTVDGCLVGLGAAAAGELLCGNAELADGLGQGLLVVVGQSVGAGLGQLIA
ncbi:hypothetical protein D9M69_643400 [compost metagenome]